MKFFIVVVFAMSQTDLADGGRDLYVFTEPTYTTQQECEQDITDPEVYPGLVAKLISEYPEPKPIDAVVCVDERTLEQSLQGSRSI